MGAHLVSASHLRAHARASWVGQNDFIAVRAGDIDTARRLLSAAADEIDSLLSKPGERTEADYLREDVREMKTALSDLKKAFNLDSGNLHYAHQNHAERLNSIEIQLGNVWTEIAALRPETIEHDDECFCEECKQAEAALFAQEEAAPTQRDLDHARATARREAIGDCAMVADSFGVTANGRVLVANIVTALRALATPTTPEEAVMPDVTRVSGGLRGPADLGRPSPHPCPPSSSVPGETRSPEGGCDA